MAAAGEAWEEPRAVFARLDGPRADWEEFKDLLAEAGIDDRRLYDASRHTAGTNLNELSPRPSWRSCDIHRSVSPTLCEGAIAPLEGRDAPDGRRVPPHAGNRSGAYV